MENEYSRTELMLGKENVETFKNKTVCIIGLGGVGGYALEALARIGIGNLVIIDKDIIDITNINRQILAMHSTIGKSKVEVAEKRIGDISKEIKVTRINESISKENIEKLLESFKFDYIIDCVDDFDAKIAIIEYANKNNIKCISSMGMGNRIDPLKIKVDDISKTYMCKLARKVRKELKNLGIKKQKVVFSTEEPIIIAEKTIGSVSFVPSVAGLIIASEVINDIVK